MRKRNSEKGERERERERDRKGRKGERKKRDKTKQKKTKKERESERKIIERKRVTDMGKQNAKEGDKKIMRKMDEERI